MRRFVFLLILAGCCLCWAFSQLTTRGVNDFLDRHPTRLNASFEYFWGVGLSLMQDPSAASQRFARVMERYPGSSRAPEAYYEYIEIMFMTNNFQAMRAAADVFFQKFPDHPRAESIRRKMNIVDNAS